MLDPEHPAKPPHDRRRQIVRLLAVGVVIGVISLLGVAACLQPNPAGLGTHQQLGLPPCTLRVMFAIRCPACGMTTSWAHFVRGEWLSSVRVNLGGFLLAMYSCVGIVVGSWIGLTGKMPSSAWQKTASLALPVVAVITALEWAGRLILEHYS